MSKEFELEASYRQYPRVTGIDEAGRGCLAGPVVVASVTWSPHVQARPFFKDLADSKTLTSQLRDRLFPLILQAAERVRVAVIGPPVIDYLNILQASLHGFEMVAPAYDPQNPLLIDGNKTPKTLPWARSVVKGDSRHSTMAAAGIIAKVSRDRLMARLAGADDPYGFLSHKGYATAAHRNAVSELGPANLHRKSFAPVKQLQPTSDEIARNLVDRLSADSPDLAGLWHHFQANYHLVPSQDTRALIDLFQAKGLAVLPTPRCRNEWI